MDHIKEPNGDSHDMPHREDSTETIVIHYSNKNLQVSDEGTIKTLNCTPLKLRPCSHTVLENINNNHLVKTLKPTLKHEEAYSKIYETIKNSPLMHNPIISLVKDTKKANLKNNYSRLITPITLNKCNKNNITYINKKNRVMSKYKSISPQKQPSQLIQSKIRVQIGKIFLSLVNKFGMLACSSFRVFANEGDVIPEMIINFDMVSISISLSIPYITYYII